MIFRGALHKMHSELASPVRYRLQFGAQVLDLHQLLGQRLKLSWQQSIHCVHCGRETKKSFNQGYCYPCFRSLAQCDICIVSPEKCHYDQGTCREPEWALEHCMQDHIVYLSNTSGLKVGITRYSQIPTRWIDQGAVQALPVLKVSKRYYAGLIEQAFKPFINDKTNWRTMLKNDYTELDLYAEFERVWPQVQGQLETCLLDDAKVIAERGGQVAIDYPAQAYPHKISSFNLDKNPHIEDTLIAIKGQYLIFDQGVINVRKYAGYDVEIEIA